MTTPSATDALLNFRTGTDDSMVALQNSIVTQQLVTARQPVWVSRYPNSQVSFPEIFFHQLDFAGTTAATTPSLGINHTHGDGTLKTEEFGTDIGPSEARAAIFVIDNPMIIDTIATTCFKIPNSAINNCYFDIFKINDDGSANRIRASSDVSSQISGVITGIVETTITPLPVQEGERYLVRLRNNSSTAVTWDPLEIDQSLFGPENYIGLYTNTLSTNTSYTAAEIQTMIDATAVVPWIALVSTGNYETERSYYDDFNRSDGYGGLGLLWGYDAAATYNWVYLLGGQVAVEPSIGAGSNVEGARVFLRPTLSDDQRVGATFYNLSSTTAEAGIMLGASIDFSNWVRLAITATGAKIYSRIGGTVVARATQSTTGDNNVEWFLAYSTSTNTYTAYRGDTVITSWTDSGNLMPHGELQRYGGIYISRVFTGGVDARGGTLDNWTLRDWT